MIPGIMASRPIKVAAYSGWNPSDKGLNITLSSENFVANGGNVRNGVRAVSGKSSGKWYFEALMSDGGAGGSVYHLGISTTSEPVDVDAPWVGHTEYGWGFTESGLFRHNGAASPSGLGAATSSAHVINVALDLNIGKVWFGRAGVSAGDPGEGTDPAFSNVAGTVHPAAWIGYSLASGNIRTDPSAHEYQPPEGFTAGWPG